MRKILAPLAALSALFSPALAFAQSSQYSTSQGLVGLIKYANNTLNDVIVLMITVAIVVFFYGIIRYVLGADGENRADALKIMGYGILAIFVMVSIWGLVHVLQSTLGVSNTDAAQAPSALQIQ